MRMHVRVGGSWLKFSTGEDDQVSPALMQFAFLYIRVHQIQQKLQLWSVACKLKFDYADSILSACSVAQEVVAGFLFVAAHIARIQSDSHEKEEEEAAACWSDFCFNLPARL